MAKRFYKMNGTNEGERIKGTDHDDMIRGRGGDDIIEAGRGNDNVHGGRGNDVILALSWGGEPEIAQETDAEKVEPHEPYEDDDVMAGGQGEDTFVFRWLIDAKDEILAKHTDDTGDIDYQAVAGENGAAHDHWVESMGNKTIADFNPEEDQLVFEGHTVNLAGIEHVDVNDDGTVDTVLTFVSVQNGGGAHDGDNLGTVTILDNVVEISNDDINRGVFYGVEDPYSADG